MNVLILIIVWFGSASAMDAGGFDGSSAVYASSSDTTVVRRPKIEFVMADVVVDDDGLKLRLTKPLSTGETDLSFEDFGRRVARVIDGDETIGDQDREIIAKSLLRNMGLFTYYDDARVQALTQHLGPVRDRLAYPELVVDALTLSRLRDIYLSLLLLKRLPKPEDDAAVAKLAAKVVQQIFSLVEKTMRDRDLMTSYPSDEQLVRLLAGLAHRPEAEYPQVWKSAVAVMNEHLHPRLESELDRRQITPSLRWAGGAAVASFFLSMAAYVQFGHLLDPEWQRGSGIAFLSAAIVGGWAGIGFDTFFLKPGRLHRARNQINLFLASCEDRLR